MLRSLSMGAWIGLRRSLWMMAGELTGVALVAILTLPTAIAAAMAQPIVLCVLKIVGGFYLLYIAWETLSQKESLVDEAVAKLSTSPVSLAQQGFLIAVSNPKAWIFYSALLPSLIVPKAGIVTQVGLLIALLLSIEFLALFTYAMGGHSFPLLCRDSVKLKLINRISGTAILCFAAWLLAVGLSFPCVSLNG